MGYSNGNCGCGTTQRIVVQRRNGCGCTNTTWNVTRNNDCGCAGTNNGYTAAQVAQARCQGAYEECLRNAQCDYQNNTAANQNCGCTAKSHNHCGCHPKHNCGCCEE